MQGFEQGQQGREGRGVIGGGILVALGLALVVQRHTSLDLGGLLWPFFIIIPGCFFYAMMLLGGRGAGSLAIPATILTTLGLIFLGQTLFDYFESWAYIWALLPTAAGIGMMIGGLWDGKPATVRAGAQTARGGATMLLIFGAFFELFIFHGARVVAILLPLALVGGGAFLLLRGIAERRARGPYGDPAPTIPDADTADEGRVFPY